MPTTPFDLPERLARKTDRALIDGDEHQFDVIAGSLAASIAELSERLDAVRKQAAGSGQRALDRDQEVHRLTARLRVLRRYGLDLCLGRMDPVDGEPIYVGRLGLTDADGARLLLDWRSPAAAPFFAATLADPMGLMRRRRYRWTAGRITDYWDEAFTDDAMTGDAALDDESAFIASLGGHRSERMRDVLGTIAADQDAIIRAGSRGVLVVDGGPGTGKTVVALHRAAYLLYTDPRLRQNRGGVLFVGPHQPYLNYVADVLPSLGEEGVQTCTLRDLVPEGADAGVETDAEVARLKSSGRLVGAVEAAVAFYEEPPDTGMRVETEWCDVRVTAGDWAEAFGAPEPGTPHNEARERIWDELVAVVVDRTSADVPIDRLRSALQRSPLRRALDRAWPMLDPGELVGDLWSVPAYLRRCAPWLEPDEVSALQRRTPDAWTVPDLPYLDAARQRLGDADTARRERRRANAVAAQRAELAEVVDHLIAADDSELQVMSMLRGEDLQNALVEDGPPATADPDRLAGPFAHVVVDEAQELTDAQWQMVLLRCPSRSCTVVGDRAQARHGFPETWQERLLRLGFSNTRLATLQINYRTPAEVMAVAAPVIRAALPDANVPVSVRSTGVAVRHGAVTERDEILDRWLAAHDGIACVVGDPSFDARPRVQSLTPVSAKGLEFDLVVLVDPAAFGEGIEAAVDTYVAMTRATQQLVVLS